MRAGRHPRRGARRPMADHRRTEKRPRMALRATRACEAARLTDCATLRNVLMPWVGFGTYRLGASAAKVATLTALRAGYRMIDTA